MVHEIDKLVIPEKYREMSIEELKQEKEKMLKTLHVKICKDCQNPNCPKCGTTHPICECVRTK